MMKHLYTTILLALLLTTTAGAQIPDALVGSCIEPDSNLIILFFDYSKNCSEADPTGHLAGQAELGFHSGAGEWEVIVPFDDANSARFVNLGNDVFTLKINTMDYYGVALADMEKFLFILRDADPAIGWDAGGGRDETGMGGFGGMDLCGDFEVFIDSLPTCAELAKESSVALFGATTAASSCVNADAGTITLEWDQSLNCPEADPDALLGSAMTLGFHSGANDWAQQVDWDDPNAMQMVNNGSGIFSVTLNTMDYYGVSLDSMTNIKMVLNNAIEDTVSMPFAAAGRDDRDGGFGGTEPCSDLVFVIAEADACVVEPEVLTSAALLTAGETTTCVDTVLGRVRIAFDNSKNCPEADTAMLLAGATALGYHSGANDWAQTVMWDDSSAMQAMNNGSDIFHVTVDVMAYYGIPYDSLKNIKIVMTNGPANPAGAFDASGRDDRDGESFGAPTDCSDLVFEIAEASFCDLSDPPETLTSPALISSAAGSCVDRNFGLVKIAFDETLNCPDADTANVLDSALAMGFHSGANDWAKIVEWDSEGAKTAFNDGNQVFGVVLNVQDYYGLPLDSIENIIVLPNNGAENPADPWSVTGKAEQAGGGFGGDEPCSNMIFVIAEAPDCDLSETATSHAILNGAAASCVDTAQGLVRLDFDYNLNCPEADSGNVLMDMAAVGFHSGINGWSIQKPWDDATAQNGINDGNNLFSVTLNVAEYYGVPMDSVSEINFLFNNGVGNPSSPWDNQGQDSRDGSGFGGSPCSNLLFDMSEAATCDLSTGTNDLDEVLLQSMTVTPNPFTDQVLIEFDNPNSKVFELKIADVSGRVVRTVSRITGEQILLERNELLPGLYFAHLHDANGYFATAKLLVK